MKMRIKALVCFMLATVLVFAAIPYKRFSVGAVDTSKSNEEALKSKLAQYQSEQAEIKKKLDSTKNDLAAKENEKQYLDSLVLATENEIETANSLLAEYTEKIATSEADIAATQVEVEDKYEELLGRMAFVYEEQSSENYLAMILESESVSDMLMTVERIGSMLDFDNTLMSELTAKLDYLENERQTLIETKADQEELKVTLEAKQTELNGQLADVEAYISNLQADEASYNAQMAKAEKAEEEANAEIEKLLAAREEQRLAEQKAAEAAKNKKNSSQPAQSGTDDTSVGGTPTYTGGSFIWPCPTSYRTITSRFANGHRGIDIPFAYGTNVFAAKSGTVVTATWHYSYGYYVLIDHGDGSSTLYAHNSKLLVSAGDRVSQGQVIAKGGNTGNSYGNHCHFEVRIGGKLVNPLNYVSQP